MGKESTGIDVATNVAHGAGEIAQRYGFVVRYYSHTDEKNLTGPELQALLAARLKVGAVWETQGDKPSYFTKAQGKADARDAMAMADALGQHKGSTIYFAVDCDTTPGGPTRGVTAYFAAVHAAFVAAGAPYLVGVYGSGSICKAIRATGFATHAWLAQSTGWQGFKTFKDYDMAQGPSQDGFGTSFDTNIVPEGRSAGLFPLD